MFGGDAPAEWPAQTLVGEVEEVVVAICDHREVEARAQLSQRGDRIGEGRPSGDRVTQRRDRTRRNRRTALGDGCGQRLTQDVPIRAPWPGFEPCLVTRVGLEQRVISR